MIFKLDAENKKICTIDLLIGDKTKKEINLVQTQTRKLKRM